MRTQEPYFMKDPEWYYHDEDDFCYKLTDKAPQKAIESYKEFYSDEYSKLYGLPDIGIPKKSV